MFLFATETNNFVELLFKTLETQEYILPPVKGVPEGGGTPPSINPPPPIEKPVEMILPPPPPAGSPPPPAQVNGATPAIVIKRETRKSDSEKDVQEKEKRSRSR